MNRPLQTMKRVIFWTYQRGTWQYDVLCALILAFIFLTPKEFFVRPPFYTRDDPKKIEQKDRRGDNRGDTQRPVTVGLTFFCF